MIETLLLHPALTPLLAAAFHFLGSPVTGLEVLAFMLSLAMVWGNLQVKVWAWPLAIAASACYGLLFAHSRLYGEAGLQVFFMAVAAWGWWRWWRAARGAADGPAKGIRRLTASLRQRITGLTLLAWPLLGLWLMRATDSDMPFADAAPTVASVTGQLLLGAKYVENWLVWLGVNLFSVGLFAAKGLWLTALLYALFSALSWWGWRTWQRQLADG